MMALPYLLQALQTCTCFSEIWLSPFPWRNAGLLAGTWFPPPLLIDSRSSVWDSVWLRLDRCPPLLHDRRLRTERALFTILSMEMLLNRGRRVGRQQATMPTLASSVPQKSMTLTIPGVVSKWKRLSRRRERTEFVVTGRPRITGDDRTKNVKSVIDFGHWFMLVWYLRNLQCGPRASLNMTRRTIPQAMALRPC